MNLFISYICNKFGLSKLGIILILASLIMCTGFAFATKYFYDKTVKQAETIGTLKADYKTLKEEYDTLKEQNKNLLADQKIDEDTILAAIKDQVLQNKDVSKAKDDLKIHVAELKQDHKLKQCIKGCVTVTEKSPQNNKSTAPTTKPTSQEQRVETALKLEKELPVVKDTTGEETELSQLSSIDKEISSERIDAVWVFYCKKVGSSEPECSKNIDPAKEPTKDKLSAGS